MIAPNHSFERTSPTDRRSTQTLGVMTTSTAICSANQAVSADVRNFILHVHDVKEESITDYLAWRWSELDRRFRYLSMRTFNHCEESSLTGADFDLELWLVDRESHLSLAVQAKKFIKPYDSYVRKLRYPNDTKQQMSALLSYANINAKLPFYFIYSVPGNGTTLLCNAGAHDGAVFMADANVMEEFADGKHGKRIARDDLLAKSKPFHCLFCCLHGPTGSYLSTYFHKAAGNSPKRSNEALPVYVRRILDGENPDVTKKEAQRPSNEGWERFKAVGVYDLRNDA